MAARATVVDPADRLRRRPGRRARRHRPPRQPRRPGQHRRRRRHASTIPVFTDRQSKTAPGHAADHRHAGRPGSRSRRPRVDADVVTVEGDAEQLPRWSRIDTEPIPVSGLVVATTGRAAGAARRRSWRWMPTASGSRSIAAGDRHLARSFEVGAPDRRRAEPGLRPTPTRPGSRADTVGGSVADLDRLIGSTLVVELDVSGLGPGDADVHGHRRPAGRAHARRRRPGHGDGDGQRAIAEPAAPSRRLTATWDASSAPTGSAASPMST